MKSSQLFSRLILFALCLLHFSAGATPVEFPLKSFFHGANYTHAITITAARPWLRNGNSLYAGSSITLTPSGGTNPIVELAPNDYLIALEDVRTPLHFSVPDTNEVVNVLSLAANGLSSYTPAIIGNEPVAVGFGLTSTIAQGTNTLAVDTSLIATNGQPVALVQLPPQAMTTANANTTNTVSYLASPYANEINPLPIAFITWQRFGSGFTGTLLTNAVKNLTYLGAIIQDVAPYIIVVDDGWQATNRDAGGRLQMDPTKWPDTPNHYTEFCRNNGIRMMLFTEPNPTTHSGSTQSIGSAGTNLTFDAQTMADWGMVGCKVDWATFGANDPGGVVAAANWKEFSTAFRARSTNGPCYFLGDLSSSPGDTTNVNAALLNGAVSGFMFRTSPEVTSMVGSTNDLIKYILIGKTFDHYYENFRVLNGVRNYVFFNEFENRFTGEALKTMGNLLCVAGNCLAYANPYDPQWEQASTMTNREFLLAALDSARNQVKLVPNTGSKTTFQVYHRELANGDKLVCLWNRTTNNTYTVPVLWTNIGITATTTMRVRDIYNLTNVGNITRGFSNSIPPMGSLLVRISPLVEASSISGSLSLRQSHFELSPVYDTMADPAQPSQAGTIGESQSPEYSPDMLYVGNGAQTTPLTRVIRIPSWATSVTGSFGVAGQSAGTMTNNISSRSFDTGSRSYGSTTQVVVNAGPTRTPVNFTYSFGSVTNKLMYIQVAANTNGTKYLIGPIILDFQ